MQLPTEKFYYFDHINVITTFVKSHQPQVPFFSSSEPSSRDDIVPHLEMFHQQGSSRVAFAYAPLQFTILLLLLIMR